MPPPPPTHPHTHTISAQSKYKLSKRELVAKHNSLVSKHSVLARLELMKKRRGGSSTRKKQSPGGTTLDEDDDEDEDGDEAQEQQEQHQQQDVRFPRARTRVASIAFARDRLHSLIPGRAWSQPGCLHSAESAGCLYRAWSPKKGPVPSPRAAVSAWSPCCLQCVFPRAALRVPDRSSQCIIPGAAVLGLDRIHPPVS